MKSSRPRFLPELLLVLAALLFTAALAEAALRITGLYRAPTYPPPRQDPERYQLYLPYGYRLVPQLRTTYSYPRTNPRTLGLAANSEGFREHEFAAAGSHPHIVFLGDSFVFGDGVEEAERFTSVLQSHHPDWKIDNLGMVGFGPDLMLRAMEHLGVKLKPDVVVWCMYTDDFRRVRPEYAGVGFEIPRYTLIGGKLTTIPYPVPTFWTRLHTTVALNKVLWSRASWQWDINRAILDRFEQLADANHFRPVIVFLPGRTDTANDRERRNWLRDYAGRHTTPYLDLTEPVLKAGAAAFIADNPHFNPTGHQVTARELEPFLARLISEQP